jgi:hypothetical protein
MPLKDKDAYNAYMRKYKRDYRKRKNDKLVELKHLASQPLTITRASELIEKINQL